MSELPVLEDKVIVCINPDCGETFLFLSIGLKKTDPLKEAV